MMHKKFSNYTIHNISNFCHSSLPLEYAQEWRHKNEDNNSIFTESEQAIEIVNTGSVLPIIYLNKFHFKT